LEVAAPFSSSEKMKRIATITTAIALLAVLALGVVLKVGVAWPPKLEDMTVDGEGGVLTVTNANLHLTVHNQTFGEISVEAVLDGSLAFGASLIRDQHFGDCGIRTRVDTGMHSVELMLHGRPPVTNLFTFETTPAMTNFIIIRITGDRRTGFQFEMKQSDHPFGIM